MINLKGRSSFIKLADQAVIGEFVCDRIDRYIPAQTVNFLLTYLKSEKGGLVYPVDLSDICLSEDEFVGYGRGKTLYGWHISDLVIYDEPKKLNDFMRKPCDFAASCGACGHAKWSGHRFDGCELSVTRPPQSFCYVEDMS